MIIVHHLNNSRSQRILWMLEELGVNYDIKFYQRDSKTMLAPEALKKVHPLGKSPVITDGEHTIAESGAIVDYLGRVHGDHRIRPSETCASHLHYQYWLHFAEGSMMPPLLLKFVMQKILEKSPTLVVKPIASAIVDKVNEGFIQPNMTQQLAYIETHLKINEWFAGGRLTGADIQMSFPLEAAAHGGLCDNYPAIIEWLDRIHTREAYKTALNKGGEYQYA